MNTTRKLIVLCLVALLGVVSVMPSTFSWYSHNGSNEGNSARYTRNGLRVSNGSVTMNTVQFDTYAADEGIHKKGDIKYDSHKNKVIKSGEPSKTVTAGTTNYYQTTFTYTGTAAAYAGFYLNGITNSTKVLIGNNYPTITEKKTGAVTRTPVPYSRTRIYFCPNGANKWTNDSTNGYFYIVGVKSDGTKATEQISSTTTTPVATGVTTYYADLPENSAEFYIAKASSSNDAKSATGFDRTPTFTKAVPATVYKLTGNPTNNDEGYAACDTEIDSRALGVTKYYSKVTMAQGQYAYIKPPSSFYQASSVSFSASSSGTGNYDVDSITGRCKITTAGTKKLVTTYTSGLGDTLELETDVDAPPTLDNLPVCQNIKLFHDDNSSDVVKIEWYITNKSSSNAEFDSIYLTI